MTQAPVHHTKSVLTLVMVFVTVIWLLYSLGSFRHKTNKIHREIAAIESQNEEMRLAIEEKRRYLEYLRTTERVEKEAKIQMGRKRPEEQVLVLVDEPLLSPLSTLPVPTTESQKIETKSIPEKWQYLLFGLTS